MPSSVIRYWKTFASSWDDLITDKYMPDGSAYRQRRFGRFTYNDVNGHIQPSANTEFFQSKKINSYVGGVNRKFAPLHDWNYHNKFLYYLIDSGVEHFRTAFDIHRRKWDISLHQFRIVASRGQPGHPTPEGIHRDGHKFISMHLIKRENIKGGESRLYNDKNDLIFNLTLRKPLDSLFVHDEVLLHGVSPIEMVDPNRSAYRDILVIDYNFCK